MEDQQPVEQNQQPTEQVPETTTPPLPAEQDQPQTIVPTPVLEPKKKRLNLWVIIIVIVLVGAGAAAYFVSTKKPTPAPKAAVTNDTVAPAGATSQSQLVHFKVGAKLLAFDIKAKQKTTLYDKLPINSQVEDIYQDASTWRVYYTVPTLPSGQDLWLLEKGGTPQKVLGSNAYYVAANAEKKVFAYSLIADYSGAGDAKTTRTYVVKAGKTDLVWQSDAVTASTGQKDTGTKNPLYNLRDISPDASHVLLGRSTCYQCDGPPLASTFEVDLATKQATSVYVSERVGGVHYIADGSLFTDESNNYALGGYSTAPAELTIKKIAKAGVKPLLLFDVKTSAWNNTSSSLDGMLVTGSKTSADAEKQSFVGVYKITGTTFDLLKKLTVAGLPFGGVFGSMQIGTASHDDCFGVSIDSMTSASSSDSDSTEYGVLCVGAGEKATFTSVENAKQTPVANVYPISQTLRN